MGSTWAGRRGFDRRSEPRCAVKRLYADRQPVHKLCCAVSCGHAWPAGGEGHARADGAPLDNRRLEPLDDWVGGLEEAPARPSSGKCRPYRWRFDAVVASHSADLARLQRVRTQHLLARLVSPFHCRAAASISHGPWSATNLDCVGTAASSRPPARSLVGGVLGGKLPGSARHVKDPTSRQLRPDSDATRVPWPLCEPVRRLASTAVHEDDDD